MDMQKELQIENPLAGRMPHELDQDVENFHRRQKLAVVVDLRTLIRGARIAQNPGNARMETVPGLTKAEESALDQEKSSNFFQQTKQLKVTILTTACAAIIQGWQQSTINATTNDYTGWTDELFHKDPINSTTNDYTGQTHELLHNDRGMYYPAFINAAPWLSGSILGTWLSDPLQERIFGRRPALFIAAIFCIACVIGTAQSNTPEELLACRLLLGIGIGSKASIAPVFAAEAAVDRLRGRTLMMWQVFDTFGIFLGFACALIVRDNWRVLLATSAIPAIVLLFLVYICPESPRYLIRQSRYADAFRSLRYLRGTDIQAARDLYYIHSQLQVETEYGMTTPPQPWYEAELYQDWLKKNNFFKRVWHLWTVPRNRRACIAACIVMAAQQLCGINILSFYSSTLFQNAARPVDGDINKFLPIWTKIKWFNFCFGFANFVFTLPAYRFIDNRGRRFLLLISLAGMTLSLAAISGFYYISDPDVRLGLVASFSIAIFTFVYSLGAGPIPFTFSAEVFPLALREVGMSFSVMVNFLGLGLLILFVPRLTQALGGGNACGLGHESSKRSLHKPCTGEGNLLFLFTGLNVLAFILSFLFVPGTQNVSLEQMDFIFRKTTRSHVKSYLSNSRWLGNRWGPSLRDEESDDPGSVELSERAAEAM